MADRTHALYRFYDRAGHLLYIGITMDPAHRWRQHRAEKPWWLQVAKITIETHESRATVLTAEATAIRRERPAHNIVHAAQPRLPAPTPQRPPQRRATTDWEHDLAVFNTDTIRRGKLALAAHLKAPADS